MLKDFCGTCKEEIHAVIRQRFCDKCNTEIGNQEEYYRAELFLENKKRGKFDWNELSICPPRPDLKMELCMKCFVAAFDSRKV